MNRNSAAKHLREGVIYNHKINILICVTTCFLPLYFTNLQSLFFRNKLQSIFFWYKWPLPLLGCCWRLLVFHFSESSQPVWSSLTSILAALPRFICCFFPKQREKIYTRIYWFWYSHSMYLGLWILLLDC